MESICVWLSVDSVCGMEIVCVWLSVGSVWYGEYLCVVISSACGMEICVCGYQHASICITEHATIAWSDCAIYDYIIITIIIIIIIIIICGMERLCVFGYQ